jgi:hypothetical protein
VIGGEHREHVGSESELLESAQTSEGEKAANGTELQGESLSALQVRIASGHAVQHAVVVARRPGALPSHGLTSRDEGDGAREGRGDELCSGVDGKTFQLVRPGTAAGSRAVIQERDRRTARSQRDGGCDAGETTTDHDHPNVFHLAPRVSASIESDHVRIARYCVQFSPFLYSREGN